MSGGVAVSDTWYYADHGGHVGPLTLQEIKVALPTLPNAKDVLVWRDGFPDWTRAGDVPELRAGTIVPPPLPAKGVSQTVDSIDPQSVEPRGIAGWLILPVLATILSPLYMVYGALQLTAAFSRAGGGTLTGILNSPNQSIKLYVLLELGFNIAMLAGWIIAIVYAFRHKKAYPKLFVFLTVLTLIGTLIDLYVSTEIFNVPFDDNDAKNIARPFLTLIVWGPYMFLSRRVRNTFVK
jgi:hypothetical protein